MNWKEIDIYDRMDYPRIGEPLLAHTMTGKDEHTSRYMPHIIIGKNLGIFLNYWVEDFERCMEISRDKVIEMRREKRKKMKI